jgi:hypothetical protein
MKQDLLGFHLLTSCNMIMSWERALATGVTTATRGII